MRITSSACIIYNDIRFVQTIFIFFFSSSLIYVCTYLPLPTMNVTHICIYIYILYICDNIKCKRPVLYIGIRIPCSYECFLIILFMCIKGVRRVERLCPKGFSRLPIIDRWLYKRTQVYTYIHTCITKIIPLIT